VKYALVFGRYEKLLVELAEIVTESERRILADEPDEFFTSHANFLVKSYLISLCSYLEVFLKEIAREHVNQIQERVAIAKIPHNILLWSTSAEVRDKDLAFKTFVLPLNDKDIDEEISGNPFRTAKLLKYLGVDIERVEDYLSLRTLVNSVVGKRNNIVHHNDSATDISLGDLRLYIGYFKSYGEGVVRAFQGQLPQ